jgi:hypothetical protein
LCIECEKDLRDWPKIDHFRTSKIDPQVVSKTAINRQYLTPPVSCVNYFLVSKPSVMDGHRWFRRGNLWEGVKIVSYIQG